MSYSTSGPVETILRKEDTVDPVAGNDNTQGYDVQSRWINTSSSKEWVCTDASTGAAVWELTTGGGGGGGGGMGQWDYVTGGAAPASTKITANTDLMSTVTTLNFHDTSLSDNTFSAAMANFTAGDYLVIRDNAGGAAFGTFLITLAVDNTTYWTFTVTAVETSGSFTATNTYDVWNLSAGNVVGPAAVTTNDVALFSGTTGKLLRSAGGVGDFSLASSVQLRMSMAGASIRMKETAAYTGSADASYGYLWVKNTAPTTLIFTDDTGVDHTMGDVVGPASSATNALARFSDTTGKVLTQSTALTYDGAGNLKNNSGSAHLTLNEHSTAPSSGTGDGKYYVKADAPNTPWFMDDTGVARHLSRPTPTTLASNALVDIDATEVVIGGAYLDGSTEGTYSWEILGTYNDNGGTGNQDLIVTLYDRGPDGTPVAGVLRSTITITALDTLDRVSQALTVASSPGVDADAIDSDEPRLYEIRAKLDAGGGVDTAKVLNVKFIES